MRTIPKVTEMEKNDSADESSMTSESSNHEDVHQLLNKDGLWTKMHLKGRFALGSKGCRTLDEDIKDASHFWNLLMPSEVLGE
jgi:hypothetical protein